jgi:hypothetical protein
MRTAICRHGRRLFDVPSERSGACSANTVDPQFDSLEHLCSRRKLENPFAMMATRRIVARTDKTSNSPDVSQCSA